MRNKLVIGRLEKVDFPEFDIHHVDAKVDTGAYTSSLHCIRIEKRTNELFFELVHHQGDKQLSKYFHTKDFYQKRIRSSNGKTQLRYIIKTHVSLLGKKYKTEFSLTDRSKMKYPVLLGRKVLKDHFIVDVSKKFVSEK